LPDLKEKALVIGTYSSVMRFNIQL